MREVFRAPALAMALGCSLLAAGCASGPIDISAPAVAELASQAALRAQAQELTARVDEAGWSLTGSSGAATRAFFGRLLGGAGADEPEDSPVSVYLAQAEAGAQVARSDLDELLTLTRAAADAAGAVATASAPLSESALGRDIAAAENAIGAVRRAHAFFSAVDQELGGDTGALAGRLDALTVERDRLVEAADALADRRWTLEHTRGLVG